MIKIVKIPDAIKDILLVALRRSILDYNEYFSVLEEYDQRVYETDYIHFLINLNLLEMVHLRIEGWSGKDFYLITENGRKLITSNNFTKDLMLSVPQYLRYLELVLNTRDDPEQIRDELFLSRKKLATLYNIRDLEEKNLKKFKQWDYENLQTALNHYNIGSRHLDYPYLQEIIEKNKNKFISVHLKYLCEYNRMYDNRDVYRIFILISFIIAKRRYMQVNVEKMIAFLDEFSSFKTNSMAIERAIDYFEVLGILIKNSSYDNELYSLQKAINLIIPENYFKELFSRLLVTCPLEVDKIEDKLYEILIDNEILDGNDEGNDEINENTAFTILYEENRLKYEMDIIDDIINRDFVKSWELIIDKIQNSPIIKLNSKELVPLINIFWSKNFPFEEPIVVYDDLLDYIHSARYESPPMKINDVVSNPYVFGKIPLLDYTGHLTTWGKFFKRFNERNIIIKNLIGLFHLFNPYFRIFLNLINIRNNLSKYELGLNSEKHLVFKSKEGSFFILDFIEDYLKSKNFNIWNEGYLLKSNETRRISKNFLDFCLNTSIIDSNGIYTSFFSDFYVRDDEIGIRNLDRSLRKDLRDRIERNLNDE